MDEQVEVLRAIWNEMKVLNGRVETTNVRLETMNRDLSQRIDSTNQRVDAMNQNLGDRIDATNHRIDSTNEELAVLRGDLRTETRRNVERDLRLGTAVAELSADVRDLTGIVHSWRDEHRLDREELRDRVLRLERRVGLEPR
ncbi:MAG TPA: hypothetical protein VH044_16480 [Polyangiaceae bacterium]|jgi:chromosome segregation ATPase|nr:hypothetical protein [Polyangiaceae bacterium]